MLKKLSLLFLLGFLCFGFIGCGEEKDPIDDPDIEEPDDEEPDDEEPDDEDPVQTEWDYVIDLPSTEALAIAENPGVVQGAPDLLILGLVLDTIEYYGPDNVLSAYEYVKVYNNTNEPYNLKGHRIVLSNPVIAGAQYDDEEARVGNKSLCSSYLFMGFIDEDFFIPATSIALIWLHPYYWFISSGTNGYNGEFSANVLYKDTYEKKGAINQTIDDFKEFWEIEDTTVPIYKLTNMGIVGKMVIDSAAQTYTPFYPIYTPGGGTPYTHLNATLLRSLEIQKFNDQDGTAEINLLNKYSDLSADLQKNPPFIHGKQCFNVMEIKDGGELVDGYLYTNAWKYFDPVVRVNFCGRVNTNTLEPGQTEVNFTATSQPGIRGIETNAELQFRPPLAGERIMQWQLPIRELALYEQYLPERQKNVLRFSPENVLTFKYIEKTIKLSVDPALGQINWKTDEIKTEARLSSANPTAIHAINITVPAA